MNRSSVPEEKAAGPVTLTATETPLPTVRLIALVSPTYVPLAL